MKYFLKYPVACLCFVWIFSGNFSSPQNAQALTAAFMVDYGLWADVLTKFVDRQGRVDYKGLMNDRAEFDRFIRQIETANLAALGDAEKKAFWINAYNALTVKVILDHYPVKSILRVNFGFVWKISRTVAGEKRSLGQIEHKILRPLGDPRIHFAINCASAGCPKLSREPFYPQSLDEQLDRAARRFINDADKVRLDRQNNTLNYSRIFKWFKADFLKDSADLNTYLLKYLNDEDKTFILENHPVGKVMDYDWSLNEQ